MKRNYNFIETNKEVLHIFKSALQKQLFIQTHKEGTYRISKDGNTAHQYLYICIDMVEGFCLTPNAISYEECLTIIEHYE